MHGNDAATDRLAAVMGERGLERLSSACVMVLGLGGVGASCAEALARGGIGGLVLVDCDRVSASNINRQSIAFTSTVGVPKVDVMARMARDINPQVSIATRNVFLVNSAIADVLDQLGRPDYVIDALDTIAPKLAVASYCYERDIPLVSSMGAANKYDPTLLRFADIQETSVCPMCKVMRRECHKRGIGRLRVLFSTEKPLSTMAGGPQSPRVAGHLPEKSGAMLGTTSYLPAIMGLMIAGDAICSIAQVGPAAMDDAT